MLLLFTQSLQHVVWADLHDVDFLLEANFLRSLRDAGLVRPNFSEATARNIRGLQQHVFGVSHVLASRTSLRRTEGFLLSIRVPVVVGLIEPVILLEGVVKVSISPPSVWFNTKEPRHGGLAVGLPIIHRTDWIKFFVEIRMDDSVTQIVVWLLPVVLWVVGRCEVDRHFSTNY